MPAGRARAGAGGDPGVECLEGPGASGEEPALSAHRVFVVMAKFWKWVAVAEAHSAPELDFSGG